MSPTFDPGAAQTPEPGPVAASGVTLPASPAAGSSAVDRPDGAAWTARYAAAVMDTFGTPSRVLVRGEGAYVWDADGRRYLDLLAGIAVNALGHAHPTLTAAISAQLGTLGHVSNFFATPAQVSLAERLLDLSGAPEGSRVFFTNSGTEANEAAVKMARRNGTSPRARILSLEGAFHGRTIGALALTSKVEYRAPFEPLPTGVAFVPAGDVRALEQAFEEPDGVSALFVEVVQGEAGVVPLPRDFLVRARELTSAHGALLVIDEVQTGVGRTGSWFAFQDSGVVPDVVTVAKGLGGGFPIGAVIAFGERAATLLGRGQHGTTFGGNPVASAAALATLGVIERDGLLGRVRELGERWADALRTASPLVAEVRGAGLLIAVQLTEPVAARLAAAALESGFVVNPVRPDAIRLAPPLILTDEQAQSFVDFLSSYRTEAPDAPALPA